MNSNAFTLRLRQGTASQHADFVGAEGEVTYDSTNKKLRVHDGATAGGVSVAHSGLIEGDLADPRGVYSPPDLTTPWLYFGTDDSVWRWKVASQAWTSFIYA